MKNKEQTQITIKRSEYWLRGWERQSEANIAVHLRILEYFQNRIQLLFPLLLKVLCFRNILGRYLFSFFFFKNGLKNFDAKKNERLCLLIWIEFVVQWSYVEWKAKGA